MISLADEYGGTDSVSKFLQQTTLPARIKEFIEFTAVKSKIYGYAIFFNKYASEHFDVDERTIRRWIEIGVKADLLRVEVSPGRRRIYVCPEILASKIAKSKFATFEEYLKGKTYRFYDLRHATGKARPVAKAKAEKKHKKKLRAIKKKSPSWHRAKRRNAKNKAAHKLVVFPADSQQVEQSIFVPNGVADIYARYNTLSPESKDSGASLHSGQREKAEAFISDPAIPVSTVPAGAYTAPDKTLTPVKRPRLWDINVYASEAERDAARAFHTSRGSKATALVGEADATGCITLREDVAEQLNTRLSASTIGARVDPPQLRTRATQALGNSPYVRQFLRAFFNAELEELPHDPVFFRSIAKRFADGPSEKPMVIDDYTEKLRTKPTQELWAKRWKLMKDFDFWQTQPQAALTRCWYEFPDGWVHEDK